MIFVTVGTQLSFERLITTVDQWGGENNNVEVFAQVGPSKLTPKHIKSADFISPSEAKLYFKTADIIVSHAGMGSILTALQYRKPIIIMPRRAALGEHRNDHQLATAKWLGNKSGIFVAEDETALLNLLSNKETLISGEEISEYGNPDFLARLKAAIDG